jgi:hypothetical protein
MSIRHVLKTVAATGAATICAGVFALCLGTGVAGANGATLTSTDGNTTLAPIGTVTPGTPYSTGQTIQLTVQANSTLNNTSLGDACVPGQFTPSTGSCPSGTTPNGNATGNFYIEECEAPNGVLPTSAGQCENATLDISQSKSNNGSVSDQFQVFYLPDTGTLGPADMTAAPGGCGLAPNYCIIGIFSVDPHAGGFSYPLLFSAPFQVKETSQYGGGRETGIDPGDGTPEVPLAIGLPLAAIAVVGGFSIRNRRRHQKQQAAA